MPLESTYSDGGTEASTVKWRRHSPCPGRSLEWRVKTRETWVAEPVPAETQGHSGGRAGSDQEQGKRPPGRLILVGAAEGEELGPRPWQERRGDDGEEGSGADAGSGASWLRGDRAVRGGPEGFL